MANATRKRTPATWQTDIVIPPGGNQHLLRVRVSGSDDDPPGELQAREPRHARLARRSFESVLGRCATRGGHADAALRD